MKIKAGDNIVLNTCPRCNSNNVVVKLVTTFSSGSTMKRTTCYDCDYQHYTNNCSIRDIYTEGELNGN